MPIFQISISILIMISVLLNTVYYLNRMNRRVFFFFDAIKNEDSSISFPDDNLSTVEKDLSNSLHQVNQKIQHEQARLGVG